MRGSWGRKRTKRIKRKGGRTCAVVPQEKQAERNREDARTETSRESGKRPRE